MVRPPITHRYQVHHPCIQTCTAAGRIKPTIAAFEPGRRRERQIGSEIALQSEIKDRRHGTVKLADFEMEFGNNLASEPGGSDIKLPLGRALVS
jgi:hypothetical protein